MTNASQDMTRACSRGHRIGPNDPCCDPGSITLTTPINASPANRALTLLVARGIRPVKPSPLKSLTRSFLSRCGLHIKISPFGDLTEAHTMRFIAAHTSIPVPKVYCAFTRKNARYIVMSKIHGHRAGWQWRKRSDASKAAILEQLRSIVQELRSVMRAGSSSRVESVFGGPVVDIRLPGASNWGPYPTATAFHEALLDLGPLSTEISTLPPDIARLREWLRQVPEETVLTHGDLSSLNIMVQGDTVTGIIDWETAGWMPLYWEYCCTWHVNPYNEFWQDEVDKFLSVDSTSFEMDCIRRRYFGDFCPGKAANDQIQHLHRKIRAPDYTTNITP